MKKALLICLLALGMAAAKAQCPVNEILTSSNAQNISTLIDNNTECIKDALLQNPEYTNMRVYLDYLYNTSKDWVYGNFPDKEKQFTEFYAKWNKEFPTMTSTPPSNPEFYEEMDAIVATDPIFFDQQKVTKIPLRYMQWLYVKRLKEKYGEQTILNLTNAVAKVANLQTTKTNYSAFVAH